MFRVQNAKQISDNEWLEPMHSAGYEEVVETESAIMQALDYRLTPATTVMLIDEILCHLYNTENWESSMQTEMFNILRSMCIECAMTLQLGVNMPGAKKAFVAIAAVQQSFCYLGDDKKDITTEITELHFLAGSKSVINEIQTKMRGSLMSVYGCLDDVPADLLVQQS